MYTGSSGSTNDPLTRCPNRVDDRFGFNNTRCNTVGAGEHFYMDVITLLASLLFWCNCYRHSIAKLVTCTELSTFCTP